MASPPGSAGAIASQHTMWMSDNALAEATSSLYKSELIRQQGPWRGVDDVELATLGWVHWFSSERLHGTLDDIPPVEFETAYHRQQETSQPVGIR